MQLNFVIKWYNLCYYSNMGWSHSVKSVHAENFCSGARTLASLLFFWGRGGDIAAAFLAL